MENQNINTTAAKAATSSAAVKAVKDKFEAAEASALERLGLYEVWSLSGTILTPQAILPDDVSLEQATDVAKGEVQQGLYKAKTVVPVFDKDKLKVLRDIRKSAQETLSKIGVQSEGQSSWTVLSARHAEVAKALDSLKGAFAGALDNILDDYDNVVAALQQEVSKISSPETRKAILDKIPSKDALRGRCTMKIQSLDLYRPNAAKTDSESFAIDVANSLSVLKDIEDGWWRKVTEPFSTMLGDIRRCAAKGRDFSQVLGKKRGAMSRAVDSALAAEGDLRIAFGATPDAGLVEDVFSLLREVRDRFCSGNRAIPKELEALCVEEFFHAAGVFESLDNLKTFLSSGDQLFESWFDLRDPAATLAAMRQKAAAESGAAAPDLMSGVEPPAAAEPAQAAEAAPEQKQPEAQAAEPALVSSSPDEEEMPQVVSDAEAAELDRLMAQSGAVVFDPDAEDPAARAAEPSAKAQAPAPAAPAEKKEQQAEKPARASGAYDANAAVTDLSALL